LIQNSSNLPTQLGLEPFWLTTVYKGVRLTTTDKLSDPFDGSKSMDIQGNPTCLSRILTDAAHLINVPALKNHFEAG
jgi:hypothetical protein